MDPFLWLVSIPQMVFTGDYNDACPTSQSLPLIPTLWLQGQACPPAPSMFLPWSCVAVDRGPGPSSLQCLLPWLFQGMATFIFIFVLVLQLPLSLPLTLLTGSLFLVFFSPLSCEPGGTSTETDMICD